MLLRLPPIQPAGDSGEGTSLQQLRERVDRLEQANVGVQRELSRLRAEARTTQREGEASRCAVRKEVDALSESLRLKEEALATLTKLVVGREVKSKREEDRLSTAFNTSTQEHIAAYPRQTQRKNASKVPLDEAKVKASLEQKLKLSPPRVHSKDISENVSSLLKEDDDTSKIHTYENAHVIWQELERLRREHITLVIYLPRAAWWCVVIHAVCPTQCEGPVFEPRGI